MREIKEFTAWRTSGFLALMALLLALFWMGWAGYGLLRERELFYLWHLLLALLASWLLGAGLFTVQPNEAVALTFLGRYVGSVREEGFHFANPLAQRRRVSLRVHNFTSEKLKVNDAQGNPIEIAAVVVWRVVDTAKALFQVESYQSFVAIQSEAAIRALASRYPYDAEGRSLRGNPEEIAEELKAEVEARLKVAGVEVLEARITHLAYAPEVAQAMLRRQQALAVVAARRLIVEAAVGMVKEALAGLEASGVALDEERRAAMVNNLMVALVSEAQAQPVVNVGTLYA
ncbi:MULTISPECIES: SPFH domain-containing protein [Thermus]|uniref:SPFH domain-containing protein n=1 Tax=Thermus tengchongensis TaxID=1214928 RepID=A0A4Y9FEM2_9DEIN|nr:MULTISPECIES: SPFH domain-containing protein [Thermus]TFU27634.1 SPFH domain-containing protein [Thermus tengchongensis]